MKHPPTLGPDPQQTADSESLQAAEQAAALHAMRERVQRVRDAMAQAYEQAGRRDRVRLLAVSKVQPFAAMQLARACGIDEFAENYAQEMADKRLLAADDSAFLNSPTAWHFIGKLQRNKVKLVVGQSGDVLIHSVDRIELLQEIDRRAASLAVNPSCLVEVNWGESQKAGIDINGVERLLDVFATCTHTTCIGLMTIPPVDEPAQTRHYFARLRELSERLAATSRERVELRELSMGMSADYVEAILEGATMVRVGSAIFGARPVRRT